MGALLPVRIARRKTSQSFQLSLPMPDDEAQPSDSDEGSEGKRSGQEDLPCYFIAYGNGKAACRLNASPLAVGVHRFASDSNTKLKTLRCSSPGSPVVLHYVSCGFTAWAQKYDLLSKGHGTEDGGFSLERKGIKSMRNHLAHRELLSRANAAELEL